MLNIIIPTYKARDTLADALNSLCAQTKKLFWVTLVQDADGEDYSDIIEEFRAHGLHISLLTREVNGGPGNARNDGIRFSSQNNFEYLMFLDADDILFPQAVEHLTREIQVNKADIIVSSFKCEKPCGFDLNLQADTTPSTWCHGRIFRTKYLIENNIFFKENLRVNEDSYFNLVATLCAKKRGILKEFTYLWRNNKSSLTRVSSSLDFFKKYSNQYILSQLYALQKIKEVTGAIPIACMAKTLYNIYSTYYCRLHFKLDVSMLLEDMRKVGQISDLHDAISNPDFWKIIIESSKLGTQYSTEEGDYFIFFDLKFTTWLRVMFFGEEL